MITFCLNRLHIVSKRNGKNKYLYTTVLLDHFSDERLLEYDIDHLVFEARSPFQKVQIVHSKSLGNLLVLDELQSRFKSSVHCFIKIS